MKKTSWTPEADQTLRDSITNGMPMSQLIIITGRGRSTVELRIRQLKLKRPRRVQKAWTKADDNHLRRLWANTEVGKASFGIEMGRSHEEILRRAEFLKLPERKVKRTSDRWKNTPITPWPKNMPKFQDHPDADPPGSLANAVKAANRYVS